MLERIVQDIRSRGNQQTAGDIGFWYLLQALARNGRSDVIYDMVAHTNIGSYGFIVRNGWTSMPEAWDADTGASMNHCMLGHIQEWFLGWVAGIRPDIESPGFRQFIIEPHPVGNLTWARASYDSIRGTIVSDWKKSDGAFTLRVTIPVGTVATVSIPAADGADDHRKRCTRLASTGRSSRGPPVEPRAIPGRIRRLRVHGSLIECLLAIGVYGAGKKGNNSRISFLEGCRPYSQISKASAKRILPADSWP